MRNAVAAVIMLGAGLARRPGNARARNISRLLVSAMVIGGAAVPAVAAETGDGDTGDTSTIVYGESFFAEHNATTAEDILRRIPGVAAMLDQPESRPGEVERRGFGSDGDQILINGRRMAGKSNEIGAALQRIQIRNVDRIELIRGTSSDIDVRSDGVVVNIILKEGAAATNSGSITLAALASEYGAIDLNGNINYNGELGNLSYFVSLDRNTLSTDGRSGYLRRYRDEIYYYPGGELLQDRHTKSDRSMEEITFAANTGYVFPRGDRLQLNALVKPTSIDERDFTPYTEFDLDGTPVRSAIDSRGRIVDQQIEWELGGNYERAVGDASNLKVLWVYNHNDNPAEEFRDEIVDGQRFEISRNPAEVLKTEAILRTSLYHPLTDKQTLEFGAEIANNTLDQTIEVFFDLNGDGTVEQIDIFAPSSKVTETRSELFVNHNWTLSDRWTAASSLVLENSTIEQRGVDINNTSTFEFLKPRLDLRFSPNSADQWRFRIERTVTQLDFANFVPRYQILQDRFSAGNPTLRPETAWEYELGFERRLSNDRGLVGARAYYNDIQDRIENVAIDLDGDGVLDPASGNIGDATEYGAEFLFSVRMSYFGVPNLIVDGRYLWRTSSVIDPFTGQERKMATPDDYEVNLGVRHDIPSHGLSYGMSYMLEGGTLIRSEWQEYRFFRRKPEIDAFLELRFPPRWTVRFDALGLARNQRKRHRYLFADGATDGTISRREYFAESRDRRFTVSVTTTF